MTRKCVPLSTIEEFWAKDRIITEDNLSDFNKGIPNLHGKYHEFYNTECINRRQLENQKKKLYLDLKRYYLGIMSLPEIKLLKREPCQFKLLKTEVDEYIRADDEYCEHARIVATSETKLKYLESILQTVNRLSFVVKTQFDLIKYRNGEF